MSQSEENNLAFEALLDYLKQSRGFDFSVYKRSSLTRRVRLRMRMVGIGSFEDYLDYLVIYPNEFVYLFNTILINVTGFFRDPPAWDYLAQTVIPALLECKPASEPFRIWSAGCASGEEAYTAAIILAEALGLETFRQRVKIYATDISEEALTQARRANYSSRVLQSLPAKLRNKYFKLGSNGYVFCNDLRRSLIFGRHDLIRDVPISHLDLLICRNTLMYFTPEAQARIIAHFHFALNSQGVLFLGKGETLLNYAHLFSPSNLKYRIFTKMSPSNLRDQLLVLAQTDRNMANHYPQLREAALWDNERTPPGISTGFNDVTHSHQLQTSLHPVNQKLEAAYEELQASKEKLGTINEQLQTTVEELATTNEELQSSNKELETMNEELQATNEALQVINDKLHQRTDELNQVNAFLRSILIGLRDGVIVVDTRLSITQWNYRSEGLWGLRADEVQGQFLLSLNIGLPVERLQRSIQACLAGETRPQEIRLPARNHQGQAIECLVICTPLLGPQGERQGVILMMEEIPG